RRRSRTSSHQSRSGRHPARPAPEPLASLLRSGGPARDSLFVEGSAAMLRKLAVTGVVAAAVLGWAAPAFAHVTVSPDEAPKGSFTTLTFQVPNEEESATTTKVEITFPSDPAIADASVQPVTGWTVAVNKVKLETPVTTDEGDTLDERVDTVTWTA